MMGMAFWFGSTGYPYQPTTINKIQKQHFSFALFR
jgi:hypothetical protein